MTHTLSLKEALDQANHAGTEIAQRLGKVQDVRLGTSEDPFDIRSAIDVPGDIHPARKRLADAAARLLQLATVPKEYLEQLAANNQHLVSIRWLINLNILQHIPENDSISYAELADLAAVPEPQLKSVARMAAAHGFLYEPSSSLVCHSRTSKLIATDANFLNWADFLLNYSVPSAYRLPEATKRWGQSDKKNETAFNIAMGLEESFFDHLRANDAMNSSFSSYMRNVAKSDAMAFKHLITGFDWDGLAPDATVVDMGGSSGHASVALANAYPTLKFVVQDLPETCKKAEAARAKSAEQDGDPLHGRLRFMSHDFFTPQPVTDADVYLLRMIIHDWPDEAAIKILGHVKDALKKPGARILVMDTILPQPGSIPLLQERQLRVRDLTMIQVFNSKEREYEDWTALLARVGLKIVRARQPEGSNMGILEIGHSDAGLEEKEVSGSLPASSRELVSSTNGSNGVAKVNGIVEHSESPTSARPNENGINGFHSPLEQSVNSSVAPITAETVLDRIELPVLIIGAGISGLCLAQHLHKNSIPFLVLERDAEENSRPQGYRLKLEADAADAIRESLSPELFRAFESSCAISTIGETDFNPISGACVKSRAGGGLAGQQGLRASYTIDRTVFRRIMMQDIKHKIRFGHELLSYKIQANDRAHVIADFKNGTTIQGRFLVGADGSNSALRKAYVPHHKFLDTGATCIYGKTIITPDLRSRYPARGLRWMTVCADEAPLIQSILIGESPLTLLSEPICFSSESRAESLVPLPEDYVYWVLIGRKELFHDNLAPRIQNGSKVPVNEHSAEASAAQSLTLTSEWHPALRSLFELQDTQQASTLRVISAPPEIPEWQSTAHVTLIGDAVHAMSPCGGVGANIALRDAAELGKLFTEAGGDEDLAGRIRAFEQALRKRAFGGLMRSFAGSKRMFDQKPFADLTVVEE